MLQPARRIGTGPHAAGRALRLAAGPAFAALVLSAAAVASAAGASARSVALSDLTFTTPSLGWLRVAPGFGVAGTLYRTDNGGVSWAVVSDHVEATSLVFKNRLDGTALVPVMGSAGMCALSLTAVSTTDGGVTWHNPAKIRAEDSPVALALSGGKPFLFNASCAGPYAAVQAPTSATGWSVLGKLTSQSPSAGFASVVSLTPNGTFAAVGYSAYGKAATPLIKGYVHRGTGVGLSSWHAVAIGSMGLPGHLTAISFANAKDGLVATENATTTALTLWATNNGGTSWSVALTVTGDDQAMLDLVNGKVAYAALTMPVSGGASSTLYKSTDGGLHWAPLVVP
jgi:hypothetical protein